MARLTRDLIIETAIKQYNLNGLRNTTIRAIAASLDISPGNLTYHFKNQENLLEAILAQMKTQRDRRIGNLLERPEPVVLGDYYALLLDFAHFQKKHAFFYRDLLEVFRISSVARTRYRSLFKERVAQGERLFQQLVIAGVMMPEPRANQFLFLSETVSSLNLGVPTRCRALGHTVSPRTQAIAVLNLCYPYLTAAGRRQFEELVSG